MPCSLWLLGNEGNNSWLQIRRLCATMDANSGYACLLLIKITHAGHLHSCTLYTLEPC
jgi:hypothetical protein